MKDKDTHILEEAYTKLYEKHSYGEGTYPVSITINGETYEDVLVHVEYDRYEGTTASGGPDPDNLEIKSATVIDDVLNDYENVVIPSDTEIFNIEGVEISEEQLIDKILGL